MPIKIPNQLPATETLTRENIFVMTETRALTQDIRPLRILLLNLMPTKVDTETQGRFRTCPKVRAVVTPIRIPVKDPGPTEAPICVKSVFSMPAFRRHSSVSVMMSFR